MARRSGRDVVCAQDQYSSLISMLETVLGPLWVWLVLNERPGAASLTGGALILAALLANTLVDLVTPRRAGVAGR